MLKGTKILLECAQRSKEEYERLYDQNRELQ